MSSASDRPVEKEEPLLSRMKSAVPGVGWPPIYTGHTATLASLALAMDASQWLPAAELRARQDLRLRNITAYFAEHNEAFRQRLGAAGIDVGGIGCAALAQLAPLTRREVLLEPGKLRGIL